MIKIVISITFLVIGAAMFVLCHGVNFALDTLEYVEENWLTNSNNKVN